MPVTFDEKSHTYTSHKGSLYISVTTLIKKYVPEFDSHYWSTYKAIKEVMEKKGGWANYKAQCGGWENVVAVTRADKAFPHLAEVMEVKKRFLSDWAKNAQDAAKKGTAIHKAKETSDVTSGNLIFNGTSFPIHEDPLKERGFEDRDGLFPELLIYDDELEIAGKADWVLKSGNDIYIKDYKTSKKIDKIGFMDQVLLHPVNDLLNANYYVYCLQMSLYGFLLERKGYTVKHLQIEHIDRETEVTIEKYDATYYKTEIEKLLEDWGANKKKIS